MQAIALNGIGFNLARAVGPALAGFLVALAGSGLAFSLFALSFPAVIGALLLWRRRPHSSGLPREHLVSAMRAGMRFVQQHAGDALRHAAGRSSTRSPAPPRGRCCRWWCASNCTSAPACTA